MENKDVLEHKDMIIELSDKSKLDIPLNITSLFDWLKKHQLNEIKSFPYWYCIVNEIDYRFKIIKQTDNLWDVYKTDKPEVEGILYFSFLPESARRFVHVFEKELSKKIKEDKNNPPSFYQPIGPVMIDF